MKQMILALAASAALAACTSNSVPTAQPTPTMPTEPVQSKAVAVGEVFKCRNGLEVRVQSLNMDQIRLSVGDQSVVMDSAVSGSGERYVTKAGLFGNTGEWHQKGSDAIFTYSKGQNVTPTEVSCRK